MKIAFYTLGCKVNQYETQALEQLFTEKGHTTVAFLEYADVYIINTCTVTASGDQKSRHMARKARLTNPQAVLVVCGCYAQVNPEEVAALCGADIVVGTAQKGEIVQRVLDFCQTKAPATKPLATIGKGATFEHLPPGGASGRTRALLKVQDGCQNYCTYCKIPYARGVSRSLPLKDAVSDSLLLSSQGYRELVITGIEISSYGKDLAATPDIGQLIQAVCSAVPDMRVRLGSLEPRTITPEFIAQISTLENLCPHFHLSLQSGCDKTLKAMNRRYDTARYFTSVSLLNNAFPSGSITTDLIVGFPGETDDDFAETLNFIEKCCFYNIHIFPFSRREGTAAYNLPNQLLKTIKVKRAATAAALVGTMRSNYLLQKVGQVLVVLFEREATGYWVGHSTEYCLVRVKGDSLKNQICKVKITQVDGDFLTGHLV